MTKKAVGGGGGGGTADAAARALAAFALAAAAAAAAAAADRLLGHCGFETLRKGRPLLSLILPT